MKFEKYQHVEKFRTQSTEGIEIGRCYVFPKIDGTNASVWVEGGEVCAGSRTRKLDLEKDNAGFFAFASTNEALKSYLQAYPGHRLFGEWLVPHTLKEYRDSAWRKFYIFDVMEGDKYLTYEEYKQGLDLFALDYLAPLVVAPTGLTDECLQRCVDENTVLLQDGAVGEGVVIKNYDYRNKYGQVVWAKVVRSEFKEKNHKAFGAPVVDARPIESDIVAQFLTSALVGKEYAKILVESGGAWESKMIPRLLGTVFHAFITEELWEALKVFKNPTVDFKKLQAWVYAETKKKLPHVF